MNQTCDKAGCDNEASRAVGAVYFCGPHYQRREWIGGVLIGIGVVLGAWFVYAVLTDSSPVFAGLVSVVYVMVLVSFIVGRST